MLDSGGLTGVFGAMEGQGWQKARCSPHLLRMMSQASVMLKLLNPHTNAFEETANIDSTCLIRRALGGLLK